MSFEKFLLKEFINNPELVHKTIDMMNNNYHLNNKTILFLVHEHNISREQAEDLWDKTMSFTNILITKHGVDFTAEKNSIIITKLKAYQNLLVAKYKKANRENKGIIIEMGDVD